MTKAERQHLNAVAGMGCIVCRRLGYPGTPSERHYGVTETELLNDVMKWNQ